MVILPLYYTFLRTLYTIARINLIFVKFITIRPTLFINFTTNFINFNN